MLEINCLTVSSSTLKWFAVERRPAYFPHTKLSRWTALNFARAEMFCFIKSLIHKTAFPCRPFLLPLPSAFLLFRPIVKRVNEFYLSLLVECWTKSSGVVRKCIHLVVDVMRYWCIERAFEVVLTDCRNPQYGPYEGIIARNKEHAKNAGKVHTYAHGRQT